MEEKDEKQKIRSNIVLEILGKPKEHVEKAINMYLDKLKNDDNKTVVINEKIHEAKEQDEGFFSTFAELEIISEDLPALIGFCFDYMPSSVEIVSPEEMKLKQGDLSNVINDLQAKLHSLDMVVKTARTENEFLKKNMNTALRNTILILLKSSSMDLETLSKLTGVKNDELKSFMDTLIKLGKIKEEDNKYFLQNE